MNRTRIEWCEYSFNPITGCLGGCSFCYARKIAMRFTGHFRPTFHPERLGQPLKIKKPSRIFADSMSDFWGEGVKQEWRNKVYKTMRKTPQHTYFLLTKRPDRITDERKIPENAWVGVSITCPKDTWRITSIIHKRLDFFVSLEPLLDDKISDWIYFSDWIIVGALTGHKNGFIPKKSTIREIIKKCETYGIPLFIKDNVKYDKIIQQFPHIFQHVTAP